MAARTAVGAGLDLPGAALMFQTKGSKKASLFPEPKIVINVAVKRTSTQYKAELRSAACTVCTSSCRRLRCTTRDDTDMVVAGVQNFALALHLFCDFPAWALNILGP